MFIDTYYDPSNSLEVSKFESNTNDLLNFAMNVKPFECKDIKTALTELMEATRAVKELEDKLKKMEEEQKDSGKFNGFNQKILSSPNT